MLQGSSQSSSPCRGSLGTGIFLSTAPSVGGSLTGLAGKGQCSAAIHRQTHSNIEKVTDIFTHGILCLQQQFSNRLPWRNVYFIGKSHGILIYGPRTYYDTGLNFYHSATQGCTTRCKYSPILPLQSNNNCLWWNVEDDAFVQPSLA